MFIPLRSAAVLLGAATFAYATHNTTSGLHVQITAADGIINGSATGRVLLLFAPPGTDPLDDLDGTSTPNYFFGKNVYQLTGNDTVAFSGGSNDDINFGVFGWPNVSLDEIPTGDYTLQAFLNQYETVTRSDGSQVSLRFPCGDGAVQVNGPGSLITPAINVTISGSQQTIQLDFDSVVPAIQFNGTEIGGCSQGNYVESETVKYVKIRSDVLSDFWKRDMYVDRSPRLFHWELFYADPPPLRLPYGYNGNDTSTRYPVIYSQGHWPGGDFAFADTQRGNWTEDWDRGVISGVNGTADRAAPKLILVTIRHESPYYDDSDAVNTANIGPYGDAINDELIPEIDRRFNTIAEPYARIQEGGSTSGWISAASLIFRPDLFGACFSYYPDSLDFHRHQDIPLYDYKNAYIRPNGSAIYSIRENVNGTLKEVTTVAQENHWELTYGTSSRSYGQWDVWNAVFGVQGVNGYPHEPWDKVTGEIYPEAVEYWKPMDLSHYVTSNWDTEKNLGEILRGRIFIYVGSWDDYYLNEGVMEFQKRTDAKGGPGWANVTIFANQPHGGLYQRREFWNYIEFLDEFIRDHAPDGKTPLPASSTTSAARGNQWEEVLARGGYQAALARQASPELKLKHRGQGRVVVVKGSVGRWDPGVALEAQWLMDGAPSGAAFPVAQRETLLYTPTTDGVPEQLQLAVTGRKRGYADETRTSNSVNRSSL